MLREAAPQPPGSCRAPIRSAGWRRPSPCPARVPRPGPPPPPRRRASGRRGRSGAGELLETCRALKGGGWALGFAPLRRCLERGAAPRDGVGKLSPAPPACSPGVFFGRASGTRCLPVRLLGAPPKSLGRGENELPLRPGLFTAAAKKVKGSSMLLAVLDLTYFFLRDFLRAFGLNRPQPLRSLSFGAAVPCFIYKGDGFLHAG